MPSMRPVSAWMPTGLLIPPIFAKHSLSQVLADKNATG